MSKLGGVTPTGTVISNLPLLFADGYPTSLEVITEKQLEQFIVFMMNCSAGRAACCKDPMPVPRWWPEGIGFAFPLVKTPKLEQRWTTVMKSLVTRCYAYHNCKFMLKFCSDLAQFPLPLLKFVDQRDGTTALHNKETGKLLVTFRNENRAYDRQLDSPRKYLLLRCPARPAHQQLIDIYLCDSCDAEYATLAEVQEHERACQHAWHAQAAGAAAVAAGGAAAAAGGATCGGGARSDTPDDCLLDADQSRYLAYFRLRACDAGHPASTSRGSPGTRLPRHPPRYKRGYQKGVNLCRVPFSSPLGVVLQRRLPRAAPYAVTAAQLERIERYCLPAKAHARDPWSYTYRSGPKRGVHGWVHKYCFTTRERRARALAIETGLSPRARVLLKKCAGLSVNLMKLTEEEIIQHTKPKPPSLHPRPPRHIPVIDLCSSDDENSNSVKPSPLVDLTRASVVVPPRLNLGRGGVGAPFVPVSPPFVPAAPTDRLATYLHQLQADPPPPAHLFPLNGASHGSGGRSLPPPPPPCESSATRTRWFGKIQKNTLASENEISNGNPKRERRKLDRSRLSDCSGVNTETKTKLQALTIAKEWSFMTNGCDPMEV